ncbi:hypothetical protein NQ314_006762 [Rhamnusium bicolor]|uniref:Uncharacterized protein n=1 Tax=Rhamnusium bicolor TaxID=1586634 RepID=A0AAV8YX93_9CUCU|nr:hypothetical protein NQ314_006762 [Rhamnusium bicolor]
MTFYATIIIFLVIGKQAIGEYYWRDWNGTAPTDAFIAGNDTRGAVYIAQAFLKNQGLYVGQILGGERSITINPTLSTGPLQASSVLKVLCTNKDTLRWIPSNTTVTQKLIKYTRPVIGGVAYNNNTIYVAKYILNNYLFIGSVHTDFYAYYTNNLGNGAYSNSLYQLLIHALY